MAGQFVIKQIAQEVISEVNQPLYIGGIDPLGSDSKLTIASNGNVSTATPLTVPSLTVASKPVMSSLLASYTVTGSPVTSIDFSGLDINTHKSYRVEMELINTTSSGVEISVFFNGNTTVANYYRQFCTFTASTVAANRTNQSFGSWLPAGLGNTSETVGHILKDTNGNITFTSNVTAGAASAMEIVIYSVQSNFYVSNITQLTFTASVANSIGVGSTIRIYRSDV